MLNRTRYWPLLLLSLGAGSTMASQWSVNELHVQYADTLQPFAAPGTKSDTLIFTLQHASGWEYGGHFFFVDHTRVDNDTSFYGEWYPTFSSKKIFDISYSGLLRDMSLVLGVNAAPDSNIVKYLPGLQLEWNVPGFNFFNTLITAYIDDSEGLDSGGAPREGNSWMFDAAWQYPLEVGNQAFSIEGHAEYISSRETEIPGVTTRHWILAQVQLRWDAGKALNWQADRFFLGLEYQFWRNKLGTDQNESVAQALAVWRF